MKKASKFIILGLLIALGLYVLISFIFNKDGTMYWINYFIELLNKPLPIVGITIGALLLFIWKIIITTNYGKAKLHEYDLKKEELEKEHNEFVLNANSKLNEILELNEQIRGELAQACALSTNKKINEFGKVLENYGKDKETTNSDTTEE